MLIAAFFMIAKCRNQSIAQAVKEKQMWYSPQRDAAQQRKGISPGVSSEVEHLLNLGNPGLSP